jgi:hypothetical protein
MKRYIRYNDDVSRLTRDAVKKVGERQQKVNTIYQERDFEP